MVFDQELVWAKDGGATDIDAGSPPEQNTVARVASITKTFMTAAMLQLRDENSLVLDDPPAASLSTLQCG